MFIEITTPNAQEIIDGVLEFRTSIFASERSAIGSTGFYASQEVAEWIRSEGKGSWPERHPVSKIWGKRGVSKMYRAVRYFQRGKDVVVGYGNTKGSEPRPNTNLESKMERIEKGFAIPVTDKMRRKFAVTRKLATIGETPGEDYFPLRKSTRKLVVKPRPIHTPVFRKINSQIYPLFEQKFLKSMGRKAKLADAEFRKGLSTNKD